MGRNALGRYLALGTAFGALLAGLSACGDTNTYWYCWDHGAKKPHRLGHPVSGDHVCADDELKGTGFKPQ